VKLLYCIPSLYNKGGMERVITEKVNYFATQPGYEITIVTTDQQGKSICFQLDNRVRVINLNIDFNGHFSANLFKKFILHKLKLKQYKKELLHLINDYKIDICISLCGKEIDFLAKMHLRSCIKIAEIHFSMNNRKQFITSIHKGFFWRLLGAIRTFQLKQSVKNLDKLVVLTKADEFQWRSTHNNIIQIPNPRPFENTIQSKLDSKRIITIGRLDAQKGYDMLVLAWALVAKKHDDWFLDIYGIGEWKEMLEKEISRLNLKEKVILHGVTNDVTSCYKQSSAYVMSSRYEGLPMVLLEAMSYGLPVVSFNCECGPGEVITDGVDGFLVEATNINQLAEKISLLIENEHLRFQMGKQAFTNVRRFDKMPIMQQWIELFESFAIVSN
jgi:glycosyltransferase involved in cell wall biosynthesis